MASQPRSVGCQHPIIFFALFFSDMFAILSVVSMSSFFYRISRIPNYLLFGGYVFIVFRWLLIFFLLCLFSIISINLIIGFLTLHFICRLIFSLFVVSLFVFLRWPPNNVVSSSDYPYEIMLSLWDSCLHSGIILGQSIFYCVN